MSPRDTLTMERLRDLLDYNPDTGIFTWRVRRGSSVAGTEAGCVVKYGPNLCYKQVQVDKSLQLAHRLAWFYVFGEWPEFIDHANGNGLDNRIANLRPATKQLNSANRGLPANNTSGYKGVVWFKRKQKWMARIKVNGKGIHLGYFTDKEEAALAYIKAAEQHFGDFARP